jgi:hypothetical protein
MKKTIYLLLILFVSFNLIAQNPFVKKIGNCNYAEINEITKNNVIYFGATNLEDFQNSFYTTTFRKDNFSYNEIKYYFTDLIFNKDNKYSLWGNYDYYSRQKSYSSFWPIEIDIFGNLIMIYKEYKFKDFAYYFDDNFLYLRGFDKGKYIEFVVLLKDFKGTNKPPSISKFFFIDNFDYVSFIKEFVTNKINNWQQKGEFEKISDYTLRVTKDGFDKSIYKFQLEAIARLKSYLWIYFGEKSSFKLNPYDSENETFIVNSELFGDLPIKVSIDKAPYFKDNFNKVMFKNPEFVLSNNKLVLSNLDFEFESNTCWAYNISEKLKYTNTVIDYNFDKIDINVTQSSINKATTEIENKNISVGKSSVEINIPENTKVANRYALIIGNEDYQSMQRTLNSEQNVPFAVNDAIVFRDYAVKTLGVEQENITFLTNATAGQMAQQIDKICKMLSKLGNKAELIVYYAGHGYPDENTKIPYLVPVDVSASNLEMGIKLNDFYRNLSATNAKRVVVFLDACFTGGGRSNGLLASRGIKVIPKEDALNGNLVVVSASSGLQSALPYQNEKHGMFSYYLFKKLQESKGNIALGDLFTFLKESVSLQSLKINNKEQDPTINVSPAVEQEYSKWNFKN